MCLVMLFGVNMLFNYHIPLQAEPLDPRLRMHYLLALFSNFSTIILYTEKGVRRANQANGGQLVRAGWPSSALCMHAMI